MTTLLTNGVSSAIPLILVMLGGIIAERSGVMSISLEGYMLTGAFAAVAVSHADGIWLGLTAAAAAGGIVGLVHAFLCVSARVNQIISGLAINLFALGITGFLDPVVFGAGNTGAQVPAFSNLKIPGLGAIPVVGSALFDQPMFAYLAIVLVALVSLYFRYTRSGLALHAVGEMPAAAEARGISVVRTRYAATVISGMLGGVGGAALSIGVVNSFVENMTAGRGYIALAAVVFAGWRPLVAAAACLVFGIADAAQVSLNVLGVHVATELLAMAPYVVTVLALIILGRRGRAPAALGLAFVRGQR